MACAYKYFKTLTSNLASEVKNILKPLAAVSFFFQERFKMCKHCLSNVTGRWLFHCYTGFLTAPYADEVAFPVEYQ